MANYKTIKIIDFIVQLLAVILPLAYIVWQRNEDAFAIISNVAYAYYIAIGVLFISFFANIWYLPASFRSKWRSLFGLSLALLAAMTVISVIMKALLLTLNIMFYVVPLFVIANFIIAISELIIMRRHGHRE